MIVLSLELDLRLTNQARSLKEKRMVIRSLKDRLRRKFEVSVAEVGSQDLWQRCSLGVAYVSEKKRHAQEVLDAVIRFIENSPDLEVVSCDWRVG